eukprot:3727315-Rhodomonas_salina.1
MAHPTGLTWRTCGPDRQLQGQNPGHDRSAQHPISYKLRGVRRGATGVGGPDPRGTRPGRATGPESVPVRYDATCVLREARQARSGAEAVSATVGPMRARATALLSSYELALWSLRTSYKQPGSDTL